MRRSTEGGELTGKCAVCESFLTNLLGQLGLFLFMQASVVFYAAMNIAPSEDDERTFVVAIRTLLNYLSLMTVIGIFDTYKIEFPSYVDQKSLLPYPSFPSLADLVSVDCLAEPFLRSSGFSEDDEVLVLSRLLNAAMPLLSFVFLTLFISLVVTITACVERRRSKKAAAGGTGEDDRPAAFAQQYWQRRGSMKTRLGQQECEELLGELNEAENAQLEKQVSREQAKKRLLGLFRYHIPTPEGTSFTTQLAKTLCEDLIPIWIVLYFLTFEGTVEDLISLIRCAPLAKGLEKRLADIPSISCQSRVYVRWMPVAFGGVVLLAIVIPLCLAFFLIRGSRVLRGLKARETEDSFRRAYGFLVQGYDPRFMYWELVIIGRKFLVLLLIAYYPGEDPNMRLLQVSIFAVMVLVLQLRVNPFSRQDRGVLNDLEMHALAVWTLTLIFFSIMYIQPVPASTAFSLALTAIFLNASFIGRSGWIIVKGYALAFYEVSEQFKEAEEPESVIPEIWIRAPVSIALPLIETLFVRPLKAMAVFFPVPHIVLEGSESSNAADPAYMIELRSAVDGSPSAMTADVMSMTLTQFAEATRRVFDEWQQWIQRDKARDFDVDGSERTLLKTLRRTGSIQLFGGDNGNGRGGNSLDETKVGTAVYFEEFILRWALVTAEAFEDEWVKNAAEQSNDLDQLLYVAQKMLRPQRLRTHPFRVLLDEREAADEDERGAENGKKRKGVVERRRQQMSADTDMHSEAGSTVGVRDEGHRGGRGSTERIRKKFKRPMRKKEGLSDVFKEREEWDGGEMRRLRRPAIPLRSVPWKPFNRLKPKDIFTRRVSMQIDRRLSARHMTSNSGIDDSGEGKGSGLSPMRRRASFANHAEEDTETAACGAVSADDFAAYTLSATARLSVSRLPDSPAQCAPPGDQSASCGEGNEGVGPISLSLAFAIPRRVASSRGAQEREEEKDVEEQPTQMNPPNPNTGIPSPAPLRRSVLTKQSAEKLPDQPGSPEANLERPKFMRRLTFGGDTQQGSPDTENTLSASHKEDRMTSAHAPETGTKPFLASIGTRLSHSQLSGGKSTEVLPVPHLLSASNPGDGSPSKHRRALILPASSPKRNLGDPSPATHRRSILRNRPSSFLLLHGPGVSSTREREEEGGPAEGASQDEAKPGRRLTFLQQETQGIQKEGGAERDEEGTTNKEEQERTGQEESLKEGSVAEARARRLLTALRRRLSNSQASLGREGAASVPVLERGTTGQSLAAESVATLPSNSLGEKEASQVAAETGDGETGEVGEQEGKWGLLSSFKRLKSTTQLLTRRMSNASLPSSIHSGDSDRGRRGSNTRGHGRLGILERLRSGRLHGENTKEQQIKIKEKKKDNATEVAAAARLFGTSLPLLADRSRFPFSLSILKKVGRAFFEGEMNDQVLREGLPADVLVKTVRRFLRMHPVVGIWVRHSSLFLPFEFLARVADCLARLVLPSFQAR
uniref:Transmembrane protein n=1 Tax=Chromera velia CCMP2878 TaxID=1169474 RepID=A0A0G4H2H5_9ALVE|eukprot:Cvel_24424.t1-p1 / transcript=Cvel_24424.t1 / gene=Cvel_24424 / organism=Chromera_velia_CCMP2878 / gene_product=hypothetical protein / transcript_product=hypothetical protein / location=Cvel_scaffold2638:289-5939(-) / protein_length=1470 / sequence_SO=supercontig / SO=protein_coding / is_pseudo=false